MIEVRDLTKYYGSVPAIRELNFVAGSGEIVGFLGPNGAGKTTTMRILTGYMPPTSGSAKILGYDVVDDSLQVRRNIGYLPETVPLYDDMRVREYLEYMGALHKVDHPEDRVDPVLESVNLADRSEHFIGGLSKGLRQRVGLAQALLHEPKVLILDEPSIGLDPAQIIEVRNLIREVGRERTVLLSTHILSEAQQLCDRVLIIHRGSIVAEDSPENLQAELAGADRLYVKADADSDNLEKIIKDIPGVAKIVRKKEQGEIEVASSPGKEIRAAIARAIIEADIDLLELRVLDVNLESIFLQLTREQNGEENGA